MRVFDIVYGVNVRKKANKGNCENGTYTQEETMEIESNTRIKIRSRLGSRLLRNRIKSRKRIQIKTLWQKPR